MRLLIVLLFLVNNCCAQYLLVQDDMESSSVWKGVSVNNTNSSYVGGLSNVVDNPSKYPMYSSFDTCYQIRGTGLGSSTVERDTFIYPNYFVATGRQYQVRFKLASFGLNPAAQTAAGVDGPDWIEFQYTLNNGLSWWRDAQIQGASNAMWSFDGAIGTGAKLNVTRTGSTSTTTPTIYISNAGNPIVNVAVTVPFITFSQIRIRFITNINATGETFMLDDVEIWDMSSLLPVELTEFYGKQLNNVVKLFWSTASEINNEFFEIQRSYDGIVYTKIGSVQGKGNTSYTTNYEFIDNTINNTIAYYRLKQVDFDGAYKEYDPIAIQYLDKKDLSIFYWFNLIGQEVKN